MKGPPAGPLHASPEAGVTAIIAPGLMFSVTARVCRAPLVALMKVTVFVQAPTPKLLAFALIDTVTSVLAAAARLPLAGDTLAQFWSALAVQAKPAPALLLRV